MGDFEHAGKFTIAQATKKLHALQFYFTPSWDNPDPFKVEFMAFLTDFKDNYAATWAQDEQYAKMDPIYTYQSTVRTMTLAWTVPAYTGADAKTNLQKMSKLIAMCYPVYSMGAPGKPTHIIESPNIRLKFGNLITKLTTQGASSKGSVETHGLKGFVDGISFSPNIAAGFYDPAPGQLYPMQIDLSCNFIVQHENELGWELGQSGIKLRTPNFPYGSSYTSGVSTEEKPNEACEEGSFPMTEASDESDITAGEGATVVCVRGSPVAADQKAGEDEVLSTPAEG